MPDPDTPFFTKRNLLKLRDDPSARPSSFVRARLLVNEGRPSSPAITEDGSSATSTSSRATRAQTLCRDCKQPASMVRKLFRCGRCPRLWHEYCGKPNHPAIAVQAGSGFICRKCLDVPEVDSLSTTSSKRKVDFASKSSTAKRPRLDTGSSGRRDGLTSGDSSRCMPGTERLPVGSVYPLYAAVPRKCKAFPLSRPEFEEHRDDVYTPAAEKGLVNMSSEAGQERVTVTEYTTHRPPTLETPITSSSNVSAAEEAVNASSADVQEGQEDQQVIRHTAQRTDSLDPQTRTSPAQQVSQSNLSVNGRAAHPSQRDAGKLTTLRLAANVSPLASAGASGSDPMTSPIHETKRATCASLRNGSVDPSWDRVNGLSSGIVRGYAGQARGVAELASGLSGDIMEQMREGRTPMHVMDRLKSRGIVFEDSSNSGDETKVAEPIEQSTACPPWVGDTGSKDFYEVVPWLRARAEDKEPAQFNSPGPRKTVWRNLRSLQLEERRKQFGRNHPHRVLVNGPELDPRMITTFMLQDQMDPFDPPRPEEARMPFDEFMGLPEELVFERQDPDITDQLVFRDARWERDLRQRGPRRRGGKSVEQRWTYRT